MKKLIVVTMVLMFVCVSSAFAGCPCSARKSGVGQKTAAVVADTTQSAATGTAQIVQTSVGNTVETPKTAVQAVKDTAGTALHKADDAIRSLTGDEK